MKPSHPIYLAAILTSVFTACFAGPILFSQDWAPGEEEVHNQYKELNAAGKYAEAIPPALKCLAICEEHFGPDHSATAASLNNLAALYRVMGNYAQAEPLHQRALRIREKQLGPDHPDTATSLSNLAGLYADMANYAQAEPLYQRALRINEMRLGPDHPETAVSLNNLAALYHKVGNHAQAEPLYQRALRIDEKQLGPDHPDTAISIGNLASLYADMANYAQAELFYQRGLEIREKQLGPDHPDTALSLSNLAVFYEAIGNYGQAEPLYQRSLQIREKQLGPDHPDTAVSLNNLAALHDTLGNYALAEPLYQRSLKILEKQLGPNHPNTATSLNNLAYLYHKMRNYAQAEPLHQRALRIREKQLGPDHPDTAMSLSNLARLFQDIGNYVQAEPLFQRDLRICEKQLGSEHPTTAGSLKNLAFLYQAMGNRQAGLDYARSTAKVETRHLEHMLSFTNESERFAFQRTLKPYDLPATLEDGLESANAVLRYKGIILESLLEDRRAASASRDPALIKDQTRIRDLKVRLKPMLMGGQSGGLKPDEILELQKQLMEAEKSLARSVNGLGSVRQSMAVTVQDVTSALPRDMALVEYFRYNRYLGKDQREFNYGAVVIRRGSEPAFVRCGSAELIEAAVTAYREAIEQVAIGSVDEATIKTKSRELHGLLIAKLVPHLSGINQLTICPDGILHFLPFATLLDERDRFLAETTFLYHVASGRDLISKRGRSVPHSPAFVAGNALFTCETGPGGTLAANADPGASSLLASLRSGLGAEMSAIKLLPLPGTLLETKNVAEALNTRTGSISATGAQVSESVLRSLKSPSILHLATHGFFLTDAEGPAEKDKGMSPAPARPTGPPMKNPMHRSGLALSGAQNTLDAWARGEIPDPNNDGLLLAAEVAELNLDGTELVTLSACKTALGDIVSGEGILGMRRAFAMAGARNVLMTLWDIADEPTAGFMKDFYQLFGKNRNTPQALSAMQRDWLVRLRKEEDLGIAVYLAGPFVMTAQAKRLDNPTH